MNGRLPRFAWRRDGDSVVAVAQLSQWRPQRVWAQDLMYKACVGSGSPRMTGYGRIRGR